MNGVAVMVNGDDEDNGNGDDGGWERFSCLIQNDL